MRWQITYALLLLVNLVAFGQSIDFSTPVSFAYSGELLQEVLHDLESRYGAHFSYSRQVLPLDLEIYATADEEPFGEALEILFEDTPIIYGFIADQLILSVDPLALVNTSPDSTNPDDSMTANTDMEVFVPRQSIAPPAGLAYAPVAFTMEPATQNAVEVDKDFILQEQQRLMLQAEKQAGAFEAQITLVPPVQASTQTNIFRPLNFSVNVLWGVNNALDGFEMGGFVNYIETSAQGVQMAGLYNGVTNNMRGAQFSGLANSAGGDCYGLQMAGLVNTAGGGELVQFSGLVSTARTESIFQASGLVSNSEMSRAGQVSGLVNSARDVGGAQVAGLVNTAYRSKVQIAMIANASHKSNVQIGLINIADSVNTAIGLISYARNGYRSLEIAGEEMMHLNLNYRMGVRSFYNIFHVGSTIDFSSWSLGLGIGGSVPTGRRHFLQFELLSRHVNENEGWTNELNLLNQLNIFWDVRLGSAARVTFGPTFNVAVSRLYQPDTNTWGTSLAPSWTFYDRTALDNNDNELNVKMWVGFHVGVRLNSKENIREIYSPMN